MMRICLVCLSLILPSSFSFAQDDYIDLVWSDEFDVNGTPNPSNWGYDLGANGWGNNEVQNYTSSSNNVRVENGLLIIEAKKSGGNWTSARVKSQGKKNFTYGKVVFRAKLPPGQGTWPALWMLGESVSTISWPACGEIDVMEHVGKNPTVVQAALHTPSSFGNTVNHGSTIVNTFNTEFHTYEVLWTPEKIIFSVDGTPYYTYQPANRNSSTWPFNAPFFIIMNIAMGGNFGGPEIDPALTLARMEVDYVRVYQNFSELKLEGPTIVEENETDITYKTNQIQDATYEWTLPEGAIITSGEGTNIISVNWGTTEGSVNVKVVFDSREEEKAIEVIHVHKPEGDTEQLTPLTWEINDAINTYTFTPESNSGIRVDYGIHQVVSVPALIATPTRPLDLSDHPVLHVRAKTKNKSRSVLLRMDWVDENNLSTNKSPVFNFTPLIDDGAYYDYRFNFETSNNWQSSTSPVNESRIKQLNFFIDFGTFGSRGADSLWIESIWLEKNGFQPLTPNRPSHLNGTIQGDQVALAWQDRSSNETGFELHAATEREGPYTLVNSFPSNATNSLIPHIPDHYYKIRSINVAGASEFSNTFTPTDIVTSIESNLRDVVLFPNPTSGELTIETPNSSPLRIRILNLLGFEKWETYTNSPTTKINLSHLPPGNYIVQLINNSGVSTQRLVLY